jgi:predicted amidohydrolase
MRIGSITFDHMPRGSVATIDDNVGRAIECARRIRALDLDLLCLPEGFLYTGIEARSASSTALDAKGATMRVFGDLARASRMYLAVPFLEQSSLGHVYNAVILLGRDGVPIGTYRKQMLWPSDPSFCELEGGASPGLGGGPFLTEFGYVGVQTCMEVHWPSRWVELRLRGAKLILFPSEQSGGMLLCHRAWDARCLVLSAVSKGGPSQVIDPVGHILAEWWPRTASPVFDCSLDFEIVHLDHNEAKLRRLSALLCGKVLFAFYEPERACVVTSLEPGIDSRTMLSENGVLLLDEYLEKVAEINAANRVFAIDGERSEDC